MISAAWPGDTQRRRVSWNRWMQQAARLAGKVVGREELERCSRIVLPLADESKKRLARIGRLDFEPLRRAITDLTASFGQRYPQGQQYLTRLESLEKAPRLPVCRREPRGSTR